MTDHLATLLEATVDKLARNFKGIRDLGFADIAAWAEGSPIVLDGRPFSFKDHEYLRQPYADTHPWQVHEKATQLGVTTKAILQAIYLAARRDYRGVLYLFPSKTDTLDFSKARLNPLIEDNPETIGALVRENAAGTKIIGRTPFYFRGLVSRVGVKSIPVDRIIFDELDEAPQAQVAMALQRLAHSEFREVDSLSNPTLPEYGINRLFNDTDMRYWLLKCPACGERTCMEDAWPTERDWPPCLGRDRSGRVWRACVRCGAELDTAAGEWVAKRPGAEKRGYHYTQLWSRYVDPAELAEDWMETQHLTEFYNLRVGVPWVEATNRLGLEQVLGLCGGEPNAASHDGPCAMGVDQGKELHVVVGAYAPGLDGLIVHIGAYKEWADLDGLMRFFNVTRCVVDALPEQRNARDFCQRWDGRAYMCFYQDSQRGSYRWDDKERIVACNRTESLDASHRQVAESRVALPRRSPVVEEFARHMHAVARKLEEDEVSGSRRFVYVKLGPDHWRHAFNYEVMARTQGLPRPVAYETIRPARVDRRRRGY